MEEDELSKMFAGTSISLAPVTIREWMIHFHHLLNNHADNAKRQEGYAKRLEGMIEKIEASRQLETLCIFNPAVRGQDGQSLLKRVEETEEAIESLRKIPEIVFSMKTKLDRQDGAINLLKWIGFPTLAGVGILIIRALMVGIS